MEVKLIHDEEGFQSLKKGWKELQSMGGVKNITVTWEWMSTWGEVCKKGRKVAVLIAEREGKLIGIAPLIKRKVKNFWFIPYERIELLASGEEERDDICSDYLDFIIRPGFEKGFLEAILRFLCHSRSIWWEELLLPKLDAESSTIPLLFDVISQFDLKIEKFDQELCPYAILPSSLETFLVKLGKNTRRNIRRSLGRMNKAGKPVYQLADTEKDVEKAKAILIKLHQSRWTSKGKPGVFSSEKFRAFHERMISLAHKNGWLRLGTLFLDDKPLACEYNLWFNDKIMAYQAGFDATAGRKTSIGLVGMVFAINHAISEGAAEYDFLTGVSDYKANLAKERHKIATVRIAKPSGKETIYRGIREGLKVLKKCVRFSKSVKMRGATGNQ
jgi:hypothetical protein